MGSVLFTHTHLTFLSQHSALDDSRWYRNAGWLYPDFCWISESVQFHHSVEKLGPHPHQIYGYFCAIFTVSSVEAAPCRWGLGWHLGKSTVSQDDKQVGRHWAGQFTLVGFLRRQPASTTVWTPVKWSSLLFSKVYWLIQMFSNTKTYTLVKTKNPDIGNNSNVRKTPELPGE